MKRPLVAFIDHTAVLSGAEIALLNTVPHLHARTLVILGNDGPLVDKLREHNVDVEIHELGTDLRERRRSDIELNSTGLLTSALGFAAYSARIRRRLKDRGVDIVHTNSSKSHIYGGLAARSLLLPHVWHSRDQMTKAFVSREAAVFMAAAVTVIPTHVIANSHSTAMTLPRLVRSRKPVTILPSPIRYCEPRPEPSESTMFGTIGRLAPWKGQDLFLKAFAEAFPGGNETASIIGAPLFGEEDYEAYLRALVVDLGISDRVEFRGFRSDVYGEIARLNVLVHASVIPEPFGQVIAQGQASGRAVIAADEGGPRETVTHMVDGILVRARSVSSLASAMQRLAADTELRRRLGDAGRTRVGEFSPKLVAGELDKIYATLGGRHGSHV